MAKQGLPATHPGEYLSETLEELNISQAGFADAYHACDQGNPSNNRGDGLADRTRL